jgi:hypothetical protein
MVRREQFAAGEGRYAEHCRCYRCGGVDGGRNMETWRIDQVLGSRRNE